DFAVVRMRGIEDQPLVDIREIGGMPPCRKNPLRRPMRKRHPASSFIREAGLPRSRSVVKPIRYTRLLLFRPRPRRTAVLGGPVRQGSLPMPGVRLLVVRLVAEGLLGPCGLVVRGDLLGVF